jgi:hypothetical protein
MTAALEINFLLLREFFFDIILLFLRLFGQILAFSRDWSQNLYPGQLPRIFLSAIKQGTKSIVRKRYPPDFVSIHTLIFLFQCLQETVDLSGAIRLFRPKSDY